tara:strand:- start:48 stop:224 length:177 start_codon:yes stop_codon:yes gene_type:complete
MTWFLLGVFLYVIYSFSKPFLAVMKIQKSMKEKNRKVSIHSKVSKMDIQDAEFEENIE